MSDFIQGPYSSYSNPFAVLLADGVGGEHAARSLVGAIEPGTLNVAGNVGDGDDVHELSGAVRVHVTGTLLDTPSGAERFGAWFVEEFA